MKKNNIVAGLSLALLIITSGGWIVSNDTNQELQEIVVDKNKTIEQKSTEIANLDDVIVLKDKKLEAEQKVIEKQKDQLQKNKKAIQEKDKELKANKEKIDKLNKELKKKPKVVEKVVYKEVKVNFKEEKKGSGVAVKSEANKQVAVEKQKPTRRVTVSRSSGEKARVAVAFSMTSYIAMCDTGCTGITATGIDVRNTSTYNGHRIIAVDPTIIPLWSIVRVNTASGSFTAIALDTGGAIKGHKIDFLVRSQSEAISNGRQAVSIEIIRKGK